ncbi:MAG: ABC transporter permease, partial [bacterium]
MLAIRREIEWCRRSLIRRPAYFVTAILVLATGVGATTALIAAERGVYRSRLPNSGGDRLVRIYTGASSASSTDPRRFGRSSYPEIREYAEQTETFRSVIASGRFVAQLGEDGGESVTGALVTNNYFRILNLRPVLGRLIDGGDDRQGGTANDIVISYDYWQARYGGATDVIGKLLRVNGHAFAITGVTLSSFRGTAFDYSPRFWVPVSMQAEAFGTPWVVDFPDARLFDVLAELQPAVTLRQAQA